YGDLIAKTPHLDAFCGKSVRFDRAYNQLPLCNPSRASVMTGLRPDEIKVYDLDRHFREEVPDAITLSQQFRAAGAVAARVGKIYHYNVPASIGTDGFDDPPSWDLKVNPYGRDKTEEALIFNAEPHRKISAALSWLAADGTDEEQTDGMITTETIRLLQEHQDKPFFLAAGFFRPHTPYVAPKKYFDLYPMEDMRLPWAPESDREDIPKAALAHNCPVPHYGLEKPILLQALQAYYATVSFVDAQIGRLLAALEDLNLSEKTIVVIWSDHGYHLGEHNGIWQKRTLFEPSARAPLFIRDPQAEGNGTACPRIVEFVDIYPTIMDLAFGSVPEGLAGRSLVPLLKNPLLPDETWKGEAITQILRPGRPVEGQGPPTMGRSIRTERWRFSDCAGGEAGEELYDYASDPREFHNLASDPSCAEIVAGLRRRLEKKASPLIPVTPFNPARL
ncbi:MAG: sulfatase, partial [Verrucomicrobiota bacterium]